MNPQMRDYKIWEEDGYFEHVAMRGVEMKCVEDLDCLVQEFIGELKTNKGEVVGVGTSDYGSDLKRFLGEPETMDMERNIEECVEKCASGYTDIFTCDANAVTIDDVVRIHIELNTYFGFTLVELDMKRGC